MRVQIDDAKLFFDVDGAQVVPSEDGSVERRPTVILLHGGPGGDHTYFKPFLSSLTEVAQVIYLDQRGQGRSDRVDRGDRRLSVWAADVKALCDVLEIERPIVVGISFGSFVALRYAIEYPDHPLAIGLLSTAARLDPDDIADGFGRPGGPEAARLAHAAFDGSTTLAKWLDFRAECQQYYSLASPAPRAWAEGTESDQISVDFFSDADSRFDHLDGAARVQCPVLIVNGERDPVTTAGAARQLAAAIPAQQVELHVLPDVAHDLARDAPGQTQEIVRDFVTRVWRDAFTQSTSSTTADSA